MYWVTPNAYFLLHECHFAIEIYPIVVQELKCSPKMEPDKEKEVSTLKWRCSRNCWLGFFFGFNKISVYLLAASVGDLIRRLRRSHCLLFQYLAHKYPWPMLVVLLTNWCDSSWVFATLQAFAMNCPTCSLWNFAVNNYFLSAWPTKTAMMFGSYFAALQWVALNLLTI